jgi:serpin B
MEGYSLRLANALWTDRRIELQRDFLDTLASNYSARGQVVDFRDRETACRTINDWAKEQTGGRIKEVVTPPELDEDTKLLLASAVAFRGQWYQKFSAAQTKDGPFHVTAERTVTVPLMEQKGKFRYYPPEDEEKDRAFQLLTLPFRGRAIEFVVLLPRKVDGLAELEKGLTWKTLDNRIRQAAPHEVRLTMPRFEMRTRLSLIEALEALGMKRAFERKAADFTGVTTTVPLHISRAVQEAMVVVNEEGAEAAAVAHVGKKDKGKEPPGPVEFRADRPFLFLIRHAESGTILFLGRVSNPA